MQPKITKLALTMGVLFFAASNSSHAVGITPNVKMTTRDDVVLTPVQSLSFGANLFTAAGGVCTMDADTPTEAVAQANSAANFTGNNFGELSGTGCASGNVATPGIYTITGGAAATVTISIVPDNAQGDVTFVPEGCAILYNNTAGADDICTALSTSPTGMYIAGATDNGSAVAGEGVITIGGTLTVNNALTSSTGYTDSFTLNITY